MQMLEQLHSFKKLILTRVGLRKYWITLAYTNALRVPKHHRC